MSEKLDYQEFWWLVESNDHLPLYATGHEYGEHTWTRDAHKAARFPTKEAAESLRLHLTNSRDEWTRGHWKHVASVEHGFIYDNKVTDREKRLEDALHRIYDCLESDIRVLARNKTLCHHLGVYKKAVKRALLAEREKQP